MISSEEARVQLKSFYNPDYLAEGLARLGKLPKRLSVIGQIITQAGPEWKKLESDTDGAKRILITANKDFMSLSKKDRRRLFDALLPGIARFLEDTWNLFDRLPYQSGYIRRSFRSPNHFLPGSRVLLLRGLAASLRGYESQDITWFASWITHLGYFAPDALGYVFAAAIEQGGETGRQVFDILVSSANGTHPIGTMGRHVVRAFLCSSREDGWDLIGRMLIAAQREEGLRQVILEAIDETHPMAFQRILRLTIDHDLLRFSAAIRAFGVWFGLPWEVANKKDARQALEQVHHYLTSPRERDLAIRGGDAKMVYYALWSTAFFDVWSAIPQAIALSHSSDVALRFIAVRFLAQAGLEECFSELSGALEDGDLRVCAQAWLGITSLMQNRELVSASDLFERLEGLLARLKQKQIHLKPLVWDGLPIVLDREEIAGNLTDCLGARPPQRLLPHLSSLNPRVRAGIPAFLGKSSRKSDIPLNMLLTLVGDPSPLVRSEALKVLQGFALKDSDIHKLEKLLSRQSQDLRRGILQLLLGLSDKKLMDSVLRLIHDRDEKRRIAGLEILRECKRKDRASVIVQSLALEYKQTGNPTETAMKILGEIQVESADRYSLDNALGLMDPNHRTKPEPVKPVRSGKVKLSSPAGLACLRSLDLLVDGHRNDAIEVNNGDAKVNELLGNIHYAWMLYSSRLQSRDNSTFILKDIAEEWYRTRSKDYHDTDGLELIRALAVLSLFHPFHQFVVHPGDRGIPGEIRRQFIIPRAFELKYTEIIRGMLQWLIWAHPVDGETDFLLAALEESLAAIPRSELIGVNETYWGKTRTIPQERLVYLDIARWKRDFRSDLWTGRHHARLWKAAIWLHEPVPDLPGQYVTLPDVLFAFQSGAATRDDLFHIFLGPRKLSRFMEGFHILAQFSARRLHPSQRALVDEFPVIQEIVDACRERILEIECRRGEMPTPATDPANSLLSVPGIRNLFRMLDALGGHGLMRGHGRGQSISGVFSHLIRNSYPTDTDTVDDFIQQADIHNIPESRLLELAVFAPQWAKYVQQVIGWDHLADAVWWLYAHTKDRQWSVDADIRQEWTAQISEFTPLTGDDLMDGAVDVDWFHGMVSGVGETRWKKLYKAASFASGGIGHTRARLFADAMLGRITTDQLMERIRVKRHQDSVRALGLIPLEKQKDTRGELLLRYEIMQEFLRTGKKFGSQRQSSERLAVSIGMQNLARTAGYADPQRLEWAMEMEAVSDLASGPVSVTVDEYQVVLSINDLGEPILETTRQGKPVKSIPSSHRKNEAISGLLERKTKLDRQAGRMRSSLELAMCRGDEFEMTELSGLFNHPMLKVMIEQLVFISPQGLGYPIRSGKALYRHDGSEISLAGTDRLRIAHPLDLLESREWHFWQRECFINERIQPFKQIFRELYIPTTAEKEEGNLSRRYAGHQVNPRQAMALFAGRGWVIDQSEGVQKTFHTDGISARVGFLQAMFTPAEVEDAAMESVIFTKRGEWIALPLDAIPPRIFSEVMRDLDLVVSVAHSGGIDPESSASSIEARTALVRETCALLKLGNVQLSKRHVIINGRLSNYNVNLGSGVVHKQPGGAICIIPVHSQHRGRIFLPFIDDDPKTAEIVSKVILLAKDDQIKDPTILEQILG